FDVAAGSLVRAAEARRKRGRVVGDDQVAGVKARAEIAARRVAQAPSRVNDEQPGVRGTLNGLGCGDHDGLPCAAGSGSAAAAWSRSSSAADSGRLSVVGSASGTARTCSGVSM